MGEGVLNFVCVSPTGKGARKFHFNIPDHDLWFPARYLQISNYYLTSSPLFPLLSLCLSLSSDRLAGLVVKASALGAKDLGFESRLWQDFSGSNHTSDLKVGTPVATLPGAWHYRVSTGTGPASVSIQWLGEVESLICNFYLSVVACKIVCADPSLRYTNMLLGR